jgi:hypothetical protein
MRLQFENRWVRLLIELLPAVPRIHRYRVVPRSVERPMQRFLRCRISRIIRQPRDKSA